MKPFASAITAVAACVILWQPVRAKAVAPYHVIDLGTLGGARSDGLAINNSGQVTGYAETTSGFDHAFRYAAGLMNDLGTLGGNQSSGNGINNIGQVTG